MNKKQILKSSRIESLTGKLTPGLVESAPTSHRATPARVVSTRGGVSEPSRSLQAGQPGDDLNFRPAMDDSTTNIFQFRKREPERDEKFGVTTTTLAHLS
jgi:hypothetical protein